MVGRGVRYSGRRYWFVLEVSIFTLTLLSSWRHCNHSRQSTKDRIRANTFLFLLPYCIPCGGMIKGHVNEAIWRLPTVYSSRTQLSSVRETQRTGLQSGPRKGAYTVRITESTIFTVLHTADFESRLNWIAYCAIAGLPRIPSPPPGQPIDEPSTDLPRRDTLAREAYPFATRSVGIFDNSLTYC